MIRAESPRLEAPAVPAHRATSRLRDYAMIAKPRLSLMVLLATAVGYYFGSPQPLDLVKLLEVLVYTALVAFGSGALNQCLERHTDKLMPRTANRPLPSGRLSYTEVLFFGVI